MSLPPERSQRLGRLAPLREILAAVARLAKPVIVRPVGLAAAAGKVLAADVQAGASTPATAVAVRDGWAVHADAVADAGPYAPVPLAPPPLWVDAGDALPESCDAVLAADAVVFTAGAAEAIAPASPGEGVAAAAFDAAGGMTLLRAGTLLRANDVAALRAVGLVNVSVRAPRVAVICADLRIDSAADLITPLIASCVAAEGGEPVCVRLAETVGGLASLLTDTAADAIVTVGGTGEGRFDRTAQAVAATGELTLHGMGIRPGETAGLGLVASRPVLLLPGRLDAALAVWLVAGRPLLRRLTARTQLEPQRKATLARKITSTIGLAEVVLVEDTDKGAVPIAAGAFAAQALLRAGGWVLVPPESEGYAVGAIVEVNPLP